MHIIKMCTWAGNTNVQIVNACIVLKGPLHIIKIRDTVACGSVLASGAQTPASVVIFCSQRAHTLLGTVKLLYLRTLF